MVITWDGAEGARSQGAHLEAGGGLVGLPQVALGEGQLGGQGRQLLRDYVIIQVLLQQLLAPCTICSTVRGSSLSPHRMKHS